MSDKTTQTFIGFMCEVKTCREIPDESIIYKQQLNLLACNEHLHEVAILIVCYRRALANIKQRYHFDPQIAQQSINLLQIDICNLKLLRQDLKGVLMCLDRIKRYIKVESFANAEQVAFDEEGLCTNLATVEMMIMDILQLMESETHNHYSSNIRLSGQ